MRLLGLRDRSLFSLLLSFSSLSLLSLSSSCFFIDANFSCSICLCFISSFFSSRKAEGIPAMFSCALKSRGHSSPINSLAFFPFKNPVRLICIILESGLDSRCLQFLLGTLGVWNRQVPCRERCSLGLLPTPYCNSTTLSLMLYHLSKLQKTNKQ